MPCNTEAHDFDGGDCRRHDGSECDSQLGFAFLRKVRDSRTELCHAGSDSSFELYRQPDTYCGSNHADVAVLR